MTVSPQWAAKLPGTKIYALLEPENQHYSPGSIRYIGKALRPTGRLRQHWRDRDKDEGSNHWLRPLNSWLRALDEPPAMVILAVIEDAREGGRVEDACIRHGWAQYGREQIVNTYINGHIVHAGRKRTPETRANMSVASKRREALRRGWKHSPEAIAKIAAAGTGRKPSAATRERLSVWQIGRKMPAEGVAKHAAALRGRELTPEHRAKLRAAKQRWKEADPEGFRAHQVTAGKAAWAKVFGGSNG